MRSFTLKVLAFGTLAFGSVTLAATSPELKQPQTSKQKSVYVTSENYFRALPQNSRLRLPPRYSPDLHPTRYQVALYNDEGVWDDGREHLKFYLQSRGLSYREITASEVLNGSLEGAQLLIMPGGESWKYLSRLGEVGAKQIRDFISKGGDYIGICAGAFYATSDRLGGYATGPYGIGLLNGVAFDGTALNADPFIEGMMNFDMFFEGFAAVYRIVLFGGPSFRYSPKEALEKKIEVFSRVQKINEPTMVGFHYGDGQVFLSGPHLEIEEGLVDWGPEYQDPDSEWPLLDVVLTRFGLFTP